jgi:hypothetical protein
VLPADVRAACAPPGVPAFIPRCLDFAAGVRAVRRLGAAALAGTAAVAGAAAGTGSGTGGAATTGAGAGIGGGGGSVFTTTGAEASAVASPRTTGELGRLIRALPDADPGTSE